MKSLGIFLRGAVRTTDGGCFKEILASCGTRAPVQYPEKMMMSCVVHHRPLHEKLTLQDVSKGSVWAQFPQHANHLVVQGTKKRPAISTCIDWRTHAHRSHFVAVMQGCGLRHPDGLLTWHHERNHRSRVELSYRPIERLHNKFVHNSKDLVRKWVNPMRERYTLMEPPITVEIPTSLALARREKGRDGLHQSIART